MSGWGCPWGTSACPACVEDSTDSARSLSQQELPFSDDIFGCVRSRRAPVTSRSRYWVWTIANTLSSHAQAQRRLSNVRSWLGGAS